MGPRHPGIRSNVIGSIAVLVRVTLVFEVQVTAGLDVCLWHCHRIATSSSHAATGRFWSAEGMGRYDPFPRVGGVDAHGPGARGAHRRPATTTPRRHAPDPPQPGGVRGPVGRRRLRRRADQCRRDHVAQLRRQVSQGPRRRRRRRRDHAGAGLPPPAPRPVLRRRRVRAARRGRPHLDGASGPGRRGDDAPPGARPVARRGLRRVRRRGVGPSRGAATGGAAGRVAGGHVRRRAGLRPRHRDRRRDSRPSPASTRCGRASAPS